MERGMIDTSTLLAMLFMLLVLGLLLALSRDGYDTIKPTLVPGLLLTRKKGTSQVIDIVKALALIVITAVALFALWDKFSKDIGPAAASGLSGPGGVLAGLALAKMFEKRKGLVVTTNMLVMVVLLVAVAGVMLLLWVSFNAEASPASNDFLFGIFDAFIDALWGGR